MRNRVTCLLASLAILCALASSAEAKGPRYTDPDQADADFAIQGEYTGELVIDGEKQRIGVQIIALGQGKFRFVGHHGGLPGDGWDGKQKHETEATKQGEAVAFEVHGGKATVENGQMTFVGPDGKTGGTLKKVRRESPTLGQKPPEGAVVLFDGTGVGGWKKGRMTEDGLLMVGTTSERRFGSHELHIEFRLPYQPEDRGQGRGNSGIYAQGRYEVQMLDSFGLAGKHNECGGIYSVKDPDVNMCLPPLSWQTYDIDYTAARFDDAGKLIASPRMSVRHNGVLVHDDVELPGDRSTTAAPMGPGPEPGPVYLQNHGCPVSYRNIWVVEKR
jgi:hypothetical protein